MSGPTLEDLRQRLLGKGGANADWDTALSGGLSNYDQLWVDGATFKDDVWHHAAGVMSRGAHVEYKGYDNRGRSQGLVVIKLVDWINLGSGFLRAEHQVASDEYYEYYATRSLQSDKCAYHLCKKTRRQCPSKLPRGDRREVVHLQEWRLVSPYTLVNSGYAKGLGMKLIEDFVNGFSPRVPEPVAPPGPVSGAPCGTGLDEAAAAAVTGGKEGDGGAAKPKEIPPVILKPRGSVGEILEKRAAERRKELLERKQAAKKKKKRSRSRSRGRRGRRKRAASSASSVESRSESGGSKGSESSKSFRMPPSRGGEELWRLSRKHPGQLLKGAMKEMSRYLAGRSEEGEIEGSWAHLKMMSYINQIVLTQHTPNSVGVRNHRELVTLGTAGGKARAEHHEAARHGGARPGAEQIGTRRREGRATAPREATEGKEDRSVRAKTGREELEESPGMEGGESETATGDSCEVSEGEESHASTFSSGQGSVNSSLVAPGGEEAFEILRSWLKEEDLGELSIAQCGALLALITLRGGGTLGNYLLKMLMPESSSGSRERRQRSLLPLPLWSDSKDELMKLKEEGEYKRLAGSSGAKKAAKEKSGRVMRRAGLLIWHGLVVTLINTLWTGGGKGGDVHRGETTKAQAAALDRLWQAVKDFVDDVSESKDKVPKAPSMSTWGTRLGDVRISYHGEVIEKAQALTLGQVLRGLPPPGYGASVRLIDLCDGELRNRLLDPRSNLLEEEELPEDMPQPRVHASKKEWELIVGELYKRGSRQGAGEGWRKTHLERGFWCGEVRKFLEDDRPILRFIMDFRSLNSATRVLEGDVRSLAGAPSVQHVVLPAGKVRRISADDLCSAFYLFSLPPGWSEMMVFREKRLPTFTRAIPRSKPPASPAGLHKCDEETIRRWQDDKMKYPPYTYQEGYLFKRDGQPPRMASINERERLMGFPAGYTLALAKHPAKIGKEAEAQVVERCAAVGNSFHAVTVACLIDLWLWSSHLRVDPVGSAQIVATWHREMGELTCSSLGPSEAASDAQLDSESRAEEMQAQQGAEGLRRVSHAGVDQREGKLLAVRLVHQFLRRTEFRGSDVRLDLNLIFRPDAVARSSIDPRRWVWKTAQAYRWRRSEHINILELRSILRSLEWRARTATFKSCRFLHLSDSQICLAVLTNGRSSSRRVNRILRKVHALCLALDLLPLWAWVASALNPADEPSRRYGPKA
eukprot:Skav205073  [mRNA]  locus=scaffold142:449288:454273:- [translate_table: standard]